MLDINVPRPACADCKEVQVIAQQAVLALCTEANIAKNTQMEERLKANLLSTPGLEINRKVVCSGRVASAAEVGIWPADAMEAA